VEFCEEPRIKIQYATTRNPQQNGHVERKNKHAQEIARTLINETGLSYSFWREVVYTTVYILNRGRSKKIVTRHHMNYGTGDQHLSNTLEFSRASVTSNKMMRTKENLTPDQMNECFLDTHQESNLKKCYNKMLQKIVESINFIID
jgi:hypothetical protein